MLSYFSYRQYYPSLSSSFSHRPYSPRIPRYEQDNAGLPSPDDSPLQSRTGLAHVGESIELAGTVKRGGEDLPYMFKKDRAEAHAQERVQGQSAAIITSDASQNV